MKGKIDLKYFAGTVWVLWGLIGIMLWQVYGGWQGFVADLVLIGWMFSLYNRINE